MEFIFLVVGILLGILICGVLRKREKIYGVIHVDHESEQIAVHLTSNDLTNRRRRTATFVINHDARLSQE